ncbi:MAG TPA: EAL domain-containing protein [Methylotenera sp.]|nr:EAL domain-containing protein [Methylotenera sp.]HPH06082.1 EAL domain-containing protein [Methylotenera sp.]
MTIGRKLMLIVATSVALVTLPAATGIYAYVKHKLLASESAVQLAETKNLVEANTQKIIAYETGLKALSLTLKQTLTPPPIAGEEAAFNRIIQQDPDGAWRNNAAIFDGKHESGLFLPPDAKLDAHQKSFHLRTKLALDAFGSSITTNTGNIWVLTLDKTEVIFDHLYPNFTSLMKADTDYTNTPWLTLGNPKTNPQREVRWTSPTLDPVSMDWIISAVLPIDLNEKWVGTVGRDIGLRKESLDIFQQNNRYQGEQRFLLDAENHMIEAGPWQEILRANPKDIEPYLEKEPALKKLLRANSSNDSTPKLQKVVFQGKSYMVTSMQLPVVKWQYFRLVPIDEILSPMRQLFYSLTSMVLAIGLLIGFLIDLAVERHIVSRVKKLANTIHQYSSGKLDARANLGGNDEIALASTEFDIMAGQLTSTLEALPDMLFDLGLDGRYYAIHAPDESLLVAPIKETLGKTVPQMLPQRAATVIMGALQEANTQGWSRGKQYPRSTPKGELWFELSIAKKSDSDPNNPRFIVLSRDVTERKNYETQLSESENRWKLAIEGSGDGVWDWDIPSNEIKYSTRWLHLFGYGDTDKLPSSYEERIALIHPDDSKQVTATLKDYIDGKSDHYLIEYRLKCKDGQYKWISSRGLVVNRDENGKPLRMIGTHTDITDRKNTELNLSISAIAFEAQESMMVSDHNQVILRVNKAFTEITGYEASEVIGKTALPLRSNLHDADFYKGIWDSVNTHGAWKGELYSMRKNGEVYPGILSITAVKDSDNRVTNYVTTLVDITREKSTADEIQFLAFYDPLTGLANRRLLIDRLNHALVSHARSGRDGALLFLDLDHFKSLNDTLGHDVGDMLLKEVAKRLTDCVREDDTVARLGGDEYVVLLENLSEKPLEAARQAEIIGTKILNALNAPYQLGIHEHHNTPSIGAALFSDHNESQEELLKHADIAMYQAKKAGRNNLRFYDPQMQEAIHQRVELERELRKAVEKRQLELYYQIQVNQKCEIIGAEALVRWIHPTRGLVPPLQFIPLAEETGLILPIGQWVLETACAQIKKWQKNDLTRNIVLSVNVSAKQFHQNTFAKHVKSALQANNINPKLLTLELTESILLEDFDATIATMNTLKKIGVQFSLDDFGTGYSSLQYLKRLPLSQLKIDQTFVRDIFTDSSDKAIVTTIIAMANSLDLEVIAEGVETAEQQLQLFDLGCNAYQGFLYGKPIPIAPFEDMLKALASKKQSGDF